MCRTLLLLFALPCLARGQPLELPELSDWSRFGPYTNDQAWSLWEMSRFHRNHVRKWRVDYPYWGRHNAARVERVIREAEWCERVWDEYTFVIVNNKDDDDRRWHLLKMRRLLGEEAWREGGELPLPGVMWVDPGYTPKCGRKWDFP